MKIRFLFFFLIFFNILKSQIIDNVDVNYFYGKIIKHNKNMSPFLVEGNPQAFLVSFNKKTFGKHEWEKIYNYPDMGASFFYQDFNNTSLGSVYSLGFHYSFYFFNRNLMLRIFEGISHSTNVYDAETNKYNISLSSRILSGTLVLLQYKKEFVFDKFGIQAGLLFNHFSNGSSKVPNSGINIIGANFGVIYNLQEEATLQAKKIDTLRSFKQMMNFKEPLRFNFSFKTGKNQRIEQISPEPFYHLGFYLDKRLNQKSAVQLGSDFFINETRKDLITYERVYNKNSNISENSDYKRVGVFIGHELFVNKTSIESQVGHYVYDPIKIGEDTFYFRLGLKYYVFSKMFISLHLKTHYADAEAIELGLGARL